MLGTWNKSVSEWHFSVETALDELELKMARSSHLQVPWGCWVCSEALSPQRSLWKPMIRRMLLGDVALTTMTAKMKTTMTKLRTAAWAGVALTPSSRLASFSSSSLLPSPPQLSPTQMNMKKTLRETQTLRAGCSMAEPKNFAPPQTPFPGAQDGQNYLSPGDSHYLHLQTLKFGENWCTQFRVIVVTDTARRPPQTGPITIHCAARSVIMPL